MVCFLLMLCLQHVFGSARGKSAKHNDRCVFVCWNNQIKSCAIGICYNNDYLHYDFHAFQLKLMILLTLALLYINQPRKFQHVPMILSYSQQLLNHLMVICDW